MKLYNNIFTKIIFLVGVLLLKKCSAQNITKYVDPNIGGVAPLLTTLPPTVSRPHSMVRVFPITKPGLEDRYLSDKIYCFVVNMPAYRRVYVTELMPTTGKIIIDRDTNAATYDHDLEDVPHGITGLFWKSPILLQIGLPRNAQYFTDLNSIKRIRKIFYFAQREIQI
jgi:hypothetical protein